jgi:hypothetical protein
MSRQRITVGLVALAMSACQPNESPPGAAAPADDVRTDSSTVAHPSLRDSAPESIGGVLLALDGEGVRLVLESTGSTRLLAFGMEARAVVTALTAALGSPISRGTNADCGAGPMDFVVFPDGLAIGIQQERFVGWSTRASATDGSMTTMSGLGVGSTRAALESTYVADIARSTLGVEFTAGGIAGVLDGEGASARITDLWAGMNCVAR